jgi:hypothetical protein
MERLFIIQCEYDSANEYSSGFRINFCIISIHSEKSSNQSWLQSLASYCTNSLYTILRLRMAHNFTRERVSNKKDHH